MHDMRAGHRGFTLIEAMVVMAIIAVLGAISTITYRIYVERAAAADLVSAHHNIRNYIQGLGGKSADDCAALAAGYERKLLSDPYARLDYGFEAVPGGFRPVLSVCATAQSDARNVPVARRAHDSFVNIGVMEKGAVLSDSVVSYALRLTDGEQALCKTAPASSGPACAPTQTAPQTAPQATQPQAAIPECPSGQLKNAAGACVAPPDPAALVAALTPEQKAVLAAQPPDPVEQFQPGFTAASAPPVALALVPNPAKANDACADQVSPDTEKGDSYGATCSQDFGDMCSECYVAQMCQVYCGYYKPSPEAQRALIAGRIAAMQRLCARNPDSLFPPGNPQHTEYCAYARQLMAQQ
jgi:prepilin-type N-terminal cleavage/methylation domain-containing protein